MAEVHTDRLPLSDEEVAELEEQVFDTVEDRPDEVHIWESDKTHYHGRDENNEAHIGIDVPRFTDVERDRNIPRPPGIDTEEEEEQDEDAPPAEDQVRYVLAHEMGHDVAEREFPDKDSVDAREHLDEDGKLDAQEGMQEVVKRDPEITVTRQVFSEMLAELAGEESGGQLDFDRQPFPEGGQAVQDQVAELTTKEFYARAADRVAKVADATDDLQQYELEYISSLPNLEFRGERSVFKAKSADEYGLEAFVEHQGTLDDMGWYEGDPMSTIDYHVDLLENLKEAYQREDIDTKKVIELAWEQDALQAEYTDSRETPFFEAVDQYLDVDYETMDSDDRETVREAIAEHEDEILREVATYSVQKVKESAEELRESYQDRIEDQDSAIYFPESEDLVDWLDEHQEVYVNASYDFSHKIGCRLGRILHERGITKEDVLEQEDTYRTIAREAVEEAVEKGYQDHVAESEERTMEEFEATARYLIDRRIDHETYDTETDYRAD